MYSKIHWVLAVIALNLLAACATSQEKEVLEAAAKAQAVKEEQTQKTLDELNRQLKNQSDAVNATAKQSAQSQKLLDELNKQIKDQADVLAASLSKALPDPGAAQRAEAAKEAERRKAVETNISKTPEWFLQNDSSTDTIFVTATEGAVDMQLSIDMAMLSAKRLLIQNLGELISSRMTEFASQTNSGDDVVLNKEIERLTKTLIAEVQLSGYTRDRITVIPNGREYQTYVRLRYPTEELKKLMAKEVKKNNIMATKVRKTKAFEELEKEIEAARENRANSQNANDK
jgi:small-conductance mechanosensitive channel